MGKGQWLSEMSAAAFDALIEGHIGRTAAGQREMPVDVFIDLLVERAMVRSTQPVSLSILVRGDQIEIIPDDSIDVLVQGNAVLIGGRRLVLHLGTPTREIR